MTNKPMLSVERELLEVYTGRKEGDWVEAGHELRALLGAPAVDTDVRKILLAVVPGEDGEGEEVYANSVADVEALLCTQGDCIEELESTLANLRAAQHHGEPVAWVNGEQLRLCAKSPRHDEPDNPMLHNLPRNIGGSALRGDYCDTPLFAGPPAPVAVVMPERIQGYPAQSNHRSYNEGWNACLTKVARLNGGDCDK